MTRHVAAFLRALACVALCGAVVLASVTVTAHGADARTVARARQRPDWVWDLPPGVPFPIVPVDNPMTSAKFELGRRLFYDRRLSANGTKACAGCHEQARAFADRLPRAVGSTGQVHPRGAMMLANVAYASVLTWANPNEVRLEHQALTPMFGEHPVEMGLAGREAMLLDRLRADSTYRALFHDAFPERPEPLALETVTKALATFERGLVSFDSPYDRARLRNDSSAMSASAKRGERLFFSERTECFHCHGGVILSGSVNYVGKGTPEIEFHDNALYSVGVRRAYPTDNQGLAEFTGRPQDDGAFKAPSLRNVAVTAPYMHDGSIATLEEVVAHYERGGRLVRTGPFAGDGRRNRNRSPFVRGFTLSARERRDLIAFLRALTDSTLLADARYADPFALPRGRPAGSARPD